MNPAVLTAAFYKFVELPDFAALKGLLERQRQVELARRRNQSHIGQELKKKTK